MTSINIKELLNLGTNVHVGPNYTSVALKEFASLAVKNNVHLTVDCSKTSSVHAKEIARIGGKNVTLIV